MKTATRFLKQHKILAFFTLIGLFTFPMIVFAQDNNTNTVTQTIGGSVLELPNKSKKPHGTSISANSGFTTFSNDGTALFGIDGGFVYSSALTEKFTLKASFNQAYSISTLTNLYTALGFGISYNWKGHNQFADHNISIDGSTLLSGQEYIPGSLLSSILIKQYFFSASENVIPLTGLGANTEWHFPSSGKFNLMVGASLDVIFNGVLLLTPIKAYAGATFWF